MGKPPWAPSHLGKPLGWPLYWEGHMSKPPWTPSHLGKPPEWPHMDKPPYCPNTIPKPVLIIRERLWDYSIHPCLETQFVHNPRHGQSFSFTPSIQVFNLKWNKTMAICFQSKATNPNKWGLKDVYTLLGSSIAWINFKNLLSCILLKTLMHIIIKSRWKNVCHLSWQQRAHSQQSQL
jgi:hypothetical protein